MIKIYMIEVYIYINSCIYIICHLQANRLFRASISNLLYVYTGQILSIISGASMYINIYLPEGSHCLINNVLNLKDTFLVSGLYVQTVIIATVS